MRRLTLRLPEYLYNKLKKVKEQNPHLSLNALIVEALKKVNEEQSA